MRVWISPNQSLELSNVSEVLANVITTIGSAEFSQRILHEINTLLPIGCWSTYRIGDSKPMMYLSGSYQRKDTTHGSWNAYLSGPHLSDRTLVFGTERFAKPSVCHLTAEEIPSEIHRDRVYRQYDMIERLSVAEQDCQNSIFAVNFYRYSGQGHFSDRELMMFEMLSLPLLAAVRRHVALHQAKLELPLDLLSVESVRRTLHTHRPDLSERELDVCARVLVGMSFEGIAADLQLKLPTVKTYRNRAFERLGFHFRGELIRYYLSIARAG